MKEIFLYNFISIDKKTVVLYYFFVRLGTTHSVRQEEQMAFSGWINSNLSHDPDLKHLLPIDPEGKQLYEKLKDGLILWLLSCIF